MSIAKYSSAIKVLLPPWCRWMPPLMLALKGLPPLMPMSSLENTGKYTQTHPWCKTGQARSLTKPQTLLQPARATIVCRCSPAGQHTFCLQIRKLR